MVTIRIQSNQSEREYKLYGELDSVHKLVLREFNDIAVMIHKDVLSNSIVVIRG